MKLMRFSTENFLTQKTEYFPIAFKKLLIMKIDGVCMNWHNLDLLSAN